MSLIKSPPQYWKSLRKRVKSRKGLGEKNMVGYTCNMVATYYRCCQKGMVAMQTIKNRLGYIRVSRRGLSQEQLAMITGIKRQTISAYENGILMPGLKNALLLSEALHCHVDEIFFFDKREI